MSIWVDEAILDAQQRLITVLDNNLSGELSSLATSNFPLPEPERYIESMSEWADVYRRTNTDEVACLVDDNRNASTDRDYTGDSTQRLKEQSVPFMIMILFKDRAGFDYPQVRGRTMTSHEWLKRRGHKYKGALIRTVMQHANDGTTIDGVFLNAYSADVQKEEQFGLIASAGAMFRITQEVKIPV